MLLNHRSSVNWRQNVVACLCGVSLFFVMSSASAQEPPLYYTPGATEGVWAGSEQAGSIPVETARDALSDYGVEARATPAYDSATAQRYEQQYDQRHEQYDQQRGQYDQQYGQYDQEYDQYTQQQYDQYTQQQYDQYEASIEGQSEAYDGTYESYTRAPAERYSVVKNTDLFGVERDKCCDEWSKFARFKETKYRSNCGGLKANKGHLGISWLRSADEGEDCDYCQGGCCERGVRAASRQNRETRRDVFTSAWNKAPRRRGDNCSLGNCPEEEGCTSCR